MSAVPAESPVASDVAQVAASAVDAPEEGVVDPPRAPNNHAKGANNLDRTMGVFEGGLGSSRCWQCQAIGLTAALALL